MQQKLSQHWTFKGTASQSMNSHLHEMHFLGFHLLVPEQFCILCSNTYLKLVRILDV